MKQDLSYPCWNICTRKGRSRTWAVLRCNVYSTRILTGSKAFIPILRFICTESFGFSKTQTLKRFHNCSSMHLKPTLPISSVHPCGDVCILWGHGVRILQGISKPFPWKANCCISGEWAYHGEAPHQRKRQALFLLRFQQLHLPSFWDRYTLLSNSRKGADCVMWQQIQKERMLMQGYNSTPQETTLSRSPGLQDPTEWDRAGSIEHDKSSHYKSAGTSDGVTVFSGC